MATFSLGYPEKQRIEIAVTKTFASSNADPYAWAKAQVHVELDSFSADIEIYLDISDVVRFHSELELIYRNLTGVAEFKTLENQLYLHLEMDSLGHVKVSGFISDSDKSNQLTFEFALDQTLLSRTITEIKSALRELAMSNSN
jgi:hypothetical protein